MRSVADTRRKWSDGKGLGSVTMKNNNRFVNTNTVTYRAYRNSNNRNELRHAAPCVILVVSPIVKGELNI